MCFSVEFLNFPQFPPHEGVSLKIQNKVRKNERIYIYLASNIEIVTLFEEFGLFLKGTSSTFSFPYLNHLTVGTLV